jgi:thymidylate kinase
LVIIEGPDGGGKSTLVKQLHKDLGIELSEEAKLSKSDRNHESYRGKDAVRLRTYRALTREVVGRKSPLLYDRLYFSELIYSEAYSREVAFNYTEQVHIGRCLNAFKVPVVFCVPPFEDILKKNLKIDEEQGMDSLQEKIAKVYNTYVAIGTLFMARKREYKELKGKHGGVMARTPRDYALPPVIWYDYNKGEDYSRIKTEVMKYLAYRAQRSQNW